MPPASAKSGRPPPPPPTIGAISLTIRPGLDARRQVLRHRDDQRDLAVVLRRDDDDAAAEAIAQRVGEAAQRRLLEAADAARDDLHALDLARVVLAAPPSGVRRRRAPPSSSARPLHAPAASPPPAGAGRSRRSARASCSARPRAGRATSRCCWNHATAPAPVSASMRRTPAATPLSWVITKKPMSPVARTCVPPHSSRLKPGHRHDADAIAVLLAEERHRAGRHRLLRRSHLGLHRRVAVDLLVDDPLDPVELLARDRREVLEVEAQAIGRDQRARLLHVRAEHLAQRRVQQVRRGVVAPRRVARLVVDRRGDDVARLERAARTP